MVTIYYIVSSITFLQFYIPLVIEASRLGYKNTFIVRLNYKMYANPLSKTNIVTLNYYLKKYNIQQIKYNEVDIKSIKGVVFTIDGDIYGPPRDILLIGNLLFPLDPTKTLKISMTEHMNFMSSYHAYIDKVDYCIFSNKHLLQQFVSKSDSIKISDDYTLTLDKSFDNPKNLFLGNTKFDNIPSDKEIFTRFKLNPTKKYCLFLFPKERTHFTSEHILNIYSHLKRIGFTIIVKSRPKDKPIDLNLRGDVYINGEFYPNDSISLMKISNLCIISSSSANEETVFSKIPCIDLISDLRKYERNQYLLDDKVYIRIENDDWKNMSFKKFISVVKKLERKNSNYFDHIKEKYLFTHKNTSAKIFEFIKKNHSDFLYLEN